MGGDVLFRHDRVAVLGEQIARGPTSSDPYGISPAARAAAASSTALRK